MEEEEEGKLNLENCMKSHEIQFSEHIAIAVLSTEAAIVCAAPAQD